MASFTSSFLKFLLLVSFLFCINNNNLVMVSCVEMNVGGEKGWIIPTSKNDQLYNDWASHNRFKVNDTLRFKYNKDSVLVVTEEEYEKCRSTRPIFFSNNGDTIFKLDRPGLFYFISGVSGHCERGMKMIIKVLEIESPPPQSANQTTNATSAAEQPHGALVFSSFMVFVTTLFGAMFM